MLRSRRASDVCTFVPGIADRDVLREFFMLTALSVKINVAGYVRPRRAATPTPARRAVDENIVRPNEALYAVALEQKVPFHRVSARELCVNLCGERLRCQFAEFVESQIMTDHVRSRAVPRSPKKRPSGPRVVSSPKPRQVRHSRAVWRA